MDPWRDGRVDHLDFGLQWRVSREIFKLGRLDTTGAHSLGRVAAQGGDSRRGGGRLGSRCTRGGAPGAGGSTRRGERVDLEWTPATTVRAASATSCAGPPYF